MKSKIASEIWHLISGNKLFGISIGLAFGALMAVIILAGAVLVETVAEGASDSPKWYYSTQGSRPDDSSPGDLEFYPLILDTLPDENYNVIHLDGEMGFYIVMVCATVTEHNKITEEDNKLGSSVPNVKEAIAIRARFAALRGSLQREYNERRDNGTLNGITDPLDIIHKPREC